jgi:hypothetical protein
MKLRRLAVAVLTIATASAGLVGTADATQASSNSNRSTFARVVGPVIRDRANPRIGYVAAIYRCSGEGSLWISVKQVADGSADPALAEEGSSGIASSWSDSHRNPVTCDGRIHLQKFTVDQEEPYFTENGPTGAKSDIYAPLARGRGYVQFCLFDDNTGPEIPLSENSFRRVY